MQLQSDTIAAIATATGRGGVGIIRISGTQALAIAASITGKKLAPRTAIFSAFKDKNENILDQGIALYFPSPNSFTGQDVVELQAHGGPVILDMLLNLCLELGARQARPGEFSERAFLNDKIDLAQAEAIADLIDASSVQAARNAMRSLRGEFSLQVQQLTSQLTELRIYVEAAIDFPEEEIDFLGDGKVKNKLEKIISQLELVKNKANQGALLRDGMNVVIAGRPNAGKSSLLNKLAGYDAAIVTDIAGTTRDILKEQIQIDGMPLHIVDTAGLRIAKDKVEQIGIEKAISAIEQADKVLLVIDASCEEQLDPLNLWSEFSNQPPEPKLISIVRNKIDLVDQQAQQLKLNPSYNYIDISAKTGEGIDVLRQHLKDVMGLQTSNEGIFSARRRHIEALELANSFLQQGFLQLTHAQAGELLAEDLRLAQQALGQITGEFSADDLLGEIFSSFCIGK